MKKNWPNDMNCYEIAREMMFPEEEDDPEFARHNDKHRWGTCIDDWKRKENLGYLSLNLLRTEKEI